MYADVQVIEVFGTQLTTEFLLQVMGPQSVLPRLYFSQDRQVASWSSFGFNFIGAAFRDVKFVFFLNSNFDC